MPFWSNACKYGEINYPANDASFVSDLITAHLNAGWTTVSGDLSDMTLQSVATPVLGLQMQVRIYTATANYLNYRPIAPFTTVNVNQMRIYRHESWRYRYSISPYQSWFWKVGWDVNAGDRLGGFGCPWLPSDFAGTITSLAWVCRSDSNAFWSEGDQFYVEAKINSNSAAAEWFYIERPNPNTAPGGGRYGVAGIDSGNAYFDPLVVCSNLGLGGAYIIGGLWDCAVSKQSVNVQGVPNYHQHGHRVVFDSKVLEMITRYGPSTGWVMWFQGSSDV